MKFKKIIISILTMCLIISVHSYCYAKYVFEYITKAAEITIKN